MPPLCLKGHRKITSLFFYISVFFVHSSINPHLCLLSLRKVLDSHMDSQMRFCWSPCIFYGICSWSCSFNPALFGAKDCGKIQKLQKWPCFFYLLIFAGDLVDIVKIFIWHDLFNHGTEERVLSSEVARQWFHLVHKSLWNSSCLWMLMKFSKMIRSSKSFVFVIYKFHLQMSVGQTIPNTYIIALLCISY